MCKNPWGVCLIADLQPLFLEMDLEGLGRGPWGLYSKETPQVILR